MKPAIISNLCALILAAAFFSCKKEETPPIKQGKIWNCHHDTTWDSTQTKDALVGEWEWEFISCFWTPEDVNGEEFEGLTVEFKTDNTLEVKENGQVIQQSTWQVVNGDADLFAIEVDPPVAQLYGRILFCEKWVEFNYSFIDGCDNYFKRK